MTTTTVTANALGSYHNETATSSAKDGGSPRFKVGYVTAPNTTDSANTITVDVYDNFGITKVLAVEGFTHSTEDSVIVEDTQTTTVSGTTLVITVGGITSNQKKFYTIYGI